MTVSISKDGKPVTDLQPDLSIHAQLDKPGNWRLFLQFQTGGTLHIAALTLRAG